MVSVVAANDDRAGLEALAGIWAALVKARRQATLFRLTSAVGHWRRPPAAGPTLLVVTLPDNGWSQAIRRARRPQEGVGRKVCAQLALSRPSDFRVVTPALGRPPPEGRPRALLTEVRIH